jgi:hypothetical protein
VDPYRLPRSVVPERYDLRLEPDLAALGFRGEETVAVMIAELVREILLNAVELTIDEAAVVDGRGREQRATATVDDATETSCAASIARSARTPAACPARWPPPSSRPPIYDLQVVEAWSDLMGHAQLIRLDGDGLCGGSDPRADGAALGW